MEPTKVDLFWRKLVGHVPPLTEYEAMVAVKKIYRYCGSWVDPCDLYRGTGSKAVSHNRGRWWINPVHGWRKLIHDSWRMFASNSRYERYELDVCLMAFKRGWFNGALKEKPKPRKIVTRTDMRKKRYDALLQREISWGRKAQRAENALKKIRRSLRAYERTGL